ncbi:MAG: tetratricopeptide repeat protein [Chthoniobacter sp.]|nr:tetratricopeptide repeat protein [Chthoniobacter sp.]
MKALRLPLLAATWFLLANPLPAAEKPGIEALQGEMRAGHYDKAVVLADAMMVAEDARADEAHYLKALALFHAKKFADAAAVAGRLAGDFPKSNWRFKAVFLKAQALVEMKKFKEAAEIYKVEAARILSSDRKQALAGVIVEFADKLATKPDPKVPDSPAADFPKAYALYGKALGMEISREVRDGILFKKARAIQQAGNPAQALQDFQAYLTEFDPAWTGPAGSGAPRLPVLNSPPAGQHVAMARFHLAESLVQAGQLVPGRMELEDLLKRISAPLEEATPLAAELRLLGRDHVRAEILWLQAQSYFAEAAVGIGQYGGQQAPRNSFGGNPNSGGMVIGNTGGLPTADVTLYTMRDTDIDAAAKSCREFIAASPEGSRAVRAAWMIAEAFQNAGRADDAIAAYRDFMAGKGFRLPAGEGAQKFDEEIRATPATHLANLQMRALFRIGSILGQQKKRADAIAAWQTYVKDYPNGPQWAESQNAIIDAEFHMGMDALAERDEPLALKRFEAFLGAHPLDERAPRILYVFGAVHEAKARAMEEAKGDKAAIDAAYRKAIDEWSRLVSKYPQSAEAHSALAKSAGFHEEKFGEYEKALHIYRKLATECGVTAANTSIARLTQKSLDLSADRTFRSNEKAVVKLKLRNISACTFRLHKIDLQAYFRKMHGIVGVEGLDVSLIQPDKTWTFKPEAFAKYKPFEQDVEIPFPGNEPGAYVVTAGDDDWESTVLVLRSDLEVIVKSSRREVLAFVQDMITGKPAADVDVLVSDGKAVAATGKTGADGVFKATIESLKDLANVRLFALGKGNAASFNLDLAGLQLSSGLTAKGYIYTDRPAYRPGETVSLRGILRDVRDTAYAIPENSEFKVGVRNPQGRSLSEQTVKLSRFGTFDASLLLPAGAVNGSYVISARQDRKGKEPLVFQGVFEVRSFTLEKIKLGLEFPRRVWFRGETIEAALQVSYYWGEAVADRSLRCVMPDGRTQTVVTDGEGKAKISFDTTGMRPGSALSFTVALDGESLATTETVTLARLGFGIAAKPSQPVVIAGEPFDLAVTTTGADGKPTGETLKVTVLRMEKSVTSPVLALLPWQDRVAVEAAEARVSEVEAKTDPTTGKATVLLKLDKGGIYRLRVSGTDRFGQAITHQAAVEISDATDATKLRLFADTSVLKVGADTVVRLHSRLEKGLALVTFEGETLLSHRIVQLKKDTNEIAVQVGHDLFPNFRLAVATMDGRELRAAAKDFTVERELKVAVKPLKDAFLPGEAGKVELTVTDQTGKPVVAELSLALVNEALYAVAPDALTPILDFFQKDARRHAEFKLGATCAFRYPGTTRAVSRDVVAEGGRVLRAEGEKMKLDELQKDMAARIPQPVVAAGNRAVFSGAVEQQALKEQNSVDAKKERDERNEREDRKSAESATGEKNGKSAAPRREVRGEGRWLPSVVTGADGKAVVTIPMPENTTAWRLTARGCTVETLVGQATAQTLTRKDFFVEMKSPAFLREGDELRAVGRVHNLTDFAGPVVLKLRLLDTRDKTKVLAEREKTVVVKAKGGAEVAFDSVTIPGPLSITTELTGIADGQRDALTMDTPVEPWGLPFAAHAGGTANADTAAVLTLPAGRAYTSTWMALSVGPDLRTALFDMALRNDPGFGQVSRLHPGSWGNHPAHELLAVASALAYANTGKVDGDAPRRLADRARALVADLVSSQADDGGWAGTFPSQHVPARAFWALIAARDAGIAVHKDTIEKAAAFLLKQLESFEANDNENKAVILHALSCDKRADYAACNRIYRERNSLTTATLAYLTRAFFNIDRKEVASELAGLLEGRIKVEDGRPIRIDAAAKNPGHQDSPETTALVLLALAESKPASTLADATAQSLLGARGCFGFPTARADGAALAALSAWYALGKEQVTDTEISVQVNGKEVGVVKSAGANRLRALEVPPGTIADGRNVVEFKMRGRGRYTYAATLFGFSADMKEAVANAPGQAPPPGNPGAHGIFTNGEIHPRVQHWRQLHTTLEYRGNPIQYPSQSPVQNAENGQRVNMEVVPNRHDIVQRDSWYEMDIPLPAGARLVEGSIRVSGNAKPELLPASIRIPFMNGVPNVSYQLVGYSPGKFRALPVTVRAPADPAFLTIGPSQSLTVLHAGEKSSDPLLVSPYEHFWLGKLLFDDGDLAGALEHLTDDVGKSNHFPQDFARMRLWIHTTPKFYDARRIVEFFEILREKFPTLEIPFDRLLVVGRAYTDIGEFERSWLVFRAAISASFSNDSSISAVLEDSGRFLGSIDYQERVWREYPDTAEVLASYFALSQLLYEKAPKAHELPKEDDVQPERIAMLKRTSDLLFSFMAMYPRDPLADDAGFSLANCMLALKNYPLVVSLSSEFAATYADSPMAPGFQYMTALGLFWQNKYGDALAAARVVAYGESKDRDFARYILGQIFHAESKPREAIEWYGKVRQLYPDAAEAIAYFEKKSITLDEIAVVKPGQPVEIAMKYRNIKEAFLQVYRVDLMKLYLQRKNLGAITSVQLAGIHPELERTIPLGDGKDYIEKEKKILLPLKDEAAYLVICRGDDLFSSGMVLITPLKIEVQEDGTSGRVRANVLDTVKGGYRPEVHVKTIGSADTEFRSGETDKRGLFIADNVHGKATVIAREGESRYAFFRGETWLGTPPNTPAANAKPAVQNDVNWNENLDIQNGGIQRDNNSNWNLYRRQAPAKGVQTQKAF